MRLTVRFFIFCLMLIGSWGCSQKSAKLQKSVVPPDKTLFETGSEYLEKSQFIKARLAFQTLINTYPDRGFVLQRGRNRKSAAGRGSIQELHCFLSYTSQSGRCTNEDYRRKYEDDPGSRS